MRKFTLIELLVVIAIIGILSSILMPGLSNARHKTKSAVCASNIRQQGLAVISYTIDNDGRYINIIANEHQGRAYGDSFYAANPFQRMVAETDLLMDYMGYDEHKRYARSAANIACPFAVDISYNRSPTWMRDTDGDGTTEEVNRFPLGFTYGITSYQHYYSFYQTKWGVVNRPMVRVGETIEYGNWANAAGSRESRVIMSDVSGAYKGIPSAWLSNHPPTTNSGNAYYNDGDAAIEGNFYWRSYTQAGYVTSKSYSGNFLYDDLSVKFRKKLNSTNTLTGVHVVTMPLEFFED